MDKLGSMQAFVEIADRGSLTAAAEALGKSQPTVVRTLAKLEEVLGARLLRRTTRRLALTDEGRAYLDRCRRILADVSEAEEGVRNADSVPRGELRITAPVTFGHWHVSPAVLAFLRLYPQVQAELVLADRVVNLLDEGADLAVRIGSLPDSSLVAAGVGQMRRVVVASPALLAQAGEPSRPGDLSALPCVQFRNLHVLGAWRFRDAGLELSVPIQGPFVTNQALAAVDACVAGLGFGQFLHYQVAPALASGRLRLVLESFEVPPVPVSLVYTEARLMSQRLRLCLDFMKVALQGSLAGIESPQRGGALP